MSYIQYNFRLRGIKLPEDNQKFKILSISDIIKEEIGKLVDQSIEIFGDEASPQDCQRLLYEFKWDYDRMLERFSEVDSYDHFRGNYKMGLSLELPSQMMVDSFIKANPMYKWCPNKKNGCKKVVKIRSSDVEDIRCECDTEFCFKCLAPPHSPFPCVLLHEWVIQRDEFEIILKDYDLICPHCYQVHKDDTYPYYYYCYNCNFMFEKEKNHLTLCNYPDYANYVSVFNDYKDIQAKKDALIGVKNAEFISAVYKIAQRFLQQLLPLHAFSFYLDKEYLCKMPLTQNDVPMFDFYLKDLQPTFNELKMLMPSNSSGVLDALITYEKKNRIMEILYSLQQHLDILFEFINEKREWIFKLPEIQQAYRVDNVKDLMDDYDDEAGIEEDTDDDDDEEEGMDEDIIDESSDFEMVEKEDVSGACA